MKTFAVGQFSRGRKPSGWETQFRLVEKHIGKTSDSTLILIAPQPRFVKWAENQIVLVAKLRSNFQNQIAIAKNYEIAIAKSCEKLRFSHFGLENHSET